MFAEVFVTLLVIMDPIGNVPVFLSLTADGDTRRRRRAADQATLVAGVVIASFAVAGERLLELLDISIEALQVSGGLLLLLVALELLRGGSSSGGDESLATGGGAAAAAPNAALVPLGTPLLAGPGAIAATMVFTRDADGGGEWAIVAGALGAVLVVVWLALRFAAVVSRYVSTNAIHLMTRIMGLLLAAIAVQLVAGGVESWIEEGVS